MKIIIFILLLISNSYTYAWPSYLYFSGGRVSIRNESQIEYTAEYSNFSKDAQKAGLGNVNLYIQKCKRYEIVKKGDHKSKCVVGFSGQEIDFNYQNTGHHQYEFYKVIEKSEDLIWAKWLREQKK